MQRMLLFVELLPHSHTIFLQDVVLTITSALPGLSQGLNDVIKRDLATRTCGSKASLVQDHIGITTCDADSGQPLGQPFR